MRYDFKPDIKRLVTTAMAKQPDRVPNVEFSVADTIKQAILGNDCRGIEGEIAFRKRCFYDFAKFDLPDPHGALVSSHTSKTKDAGGELSNRNWADVHAPKITTIDDLNKINFPDPKQIDVTPLREFIYKVKAEAKDNKHNMGVMSCNGGAVFNITLYLLGFENFCFCLQDNPELVKNIADKVGRYYVEATKKICREKIDMLLFGDDIAYTEGLIISPVKMREVFMPWYRKFCEIARDNNIPVCYHSDGKLDELLPDFIEAGLNALNPIEPKAMDIAALKKRYGSKLALFGNIDIDKTLARGTKEDVEEEVKEKIEKLSSGGGYAVASSNSVPDYVPLENYLAMIEATMKFGRYTSANR